MNDETTKRQNELQQEYCSLQLLLEASQPGVTMSQQRFDSKQFQLAYVLTRIVTNHLPLAKFDCLIHEVLCIKTFRPRVTPLM